MDSWSRSIWFFSRSYITTCINIGLGLKWKWSVNFSIQAGDDKRQIKQKRNHPTGQRNKNTFKMDSIAEALAVSLCSCCKATSEDQSAALGTLVTGKAEWRGSGWAVANVPLQRGVQQMHGNHSPWAWHCHPAPEVSPSKQWCSPNSHAHQELSKMRKKSN